MMRDWFVRIIHIAQTATEPTEESSKSLVDLLKSWLQEAEFWLDVAKIAFPIALVAVCIVVFLLNTKGKVLRKLTTFFIEGAPVCDKGDCL